MKQKFVKKIKSNFSKLRKILNLAFNFVKKIGLRHMNKTQIFAFEENQNIQKIISWGEKTNKGNSISKQIFLFAKRARDGMSVPYKKTKISVHSP